MSEALLAEYVRGGYVESKHFGHLLAIDSAGNEVLVKGDPDALIYPRSAIKSIQASAMVRNGLLEKGLSDRNLALVCASHSGSSAHQAGVREILAGAGLTEAALQCIPDRPLGIAERKEWGDKEPAPIAMNCSGKHSGMLATCVANGWPIESYLNPEHPLQLAIRSELESLAQEQVANISIDGCGAPLFLLSLRGLTRAFHNLAKSADPVHQKVIAACLANPDMVAGIGRTDTDLMLKAPELFLKGGAEGVQAAFLRDGRTVIFKVIDGSERAHKVILQAALAQLGYDLEIPEIPIFGGKNKVGLIRAAL